MKLLIIGGSPRLKGGVDAFCIRSQEAFRTYTDHQVDRIPSETAYLTPARLPAFFAAMGKVIRYRREKPDVVWLQYVNLPDLLFLVLTKILGYRVLVTPHLGANWKSQSNPLLRFVSGRILEMADGIAPISKTQEREIAFPKTVERSYIRNFLPPNIFAFQLPDPTSAPPEMQLIHSGRLSEGKGTFLLVDVCKRLKDAGVPFFARITGPADDETMERLTALIAEHGVGDQVAVLGRIPEEDLLELLGRSDYLIHLSRIDSYPLIVLEATACGVFPVCLELAGARDMIETYDGYVVGEQDTVDQTATFLQSQDLESIRARARAASGAVRADYAWQACVQVAERALRMVLDKSR